MDFSKPMTMITDYLHELSASIENEEISCSATICPNVNLFVSKEEIHLSDDRPQLREARFWNEYTAYKHQQMDMDSYRKGVCSQYAVGTIRNCSFSEEIVLDWKRIKADLIESLENNRKKFRAKEEALNNFEV